GVRLWRLSQRTFDIKSRHQENTMNKIGLAAITIALFAAQAFGQDPNQGWVTVWGASQQGLGEAKITNATVRMIARVTIPGDSIRIRLDNTFGTAPFTGKTTSMLWLKSIDVRPASLATAIVAFGDSITDGTCTTLDAHDRWEDIVSQRLVLMTPVTPAFRSVVNEGIGGNTVTGAHLVPRANSPPGLERLERDVLSHSGVSHVVLFMGTNDIRRDVGAEELMAGMREISTRLKSKGIKVIGATIIPRHNVATVPD